MKKTILAALMFVVAGLPLWAQAPAAAPAAAPLFDYRETVLDNGLRVITLEDHSAPIVAVQVWYHVGSKNDAPERTGFAHLFEHMMFRGTDTLGPTDHFNLIHNCGGYNNAGTSFDFTDYIQVLPVTQLEMVLWLEAERMAFLKIDQAGFDTERKVVEEERRMGLNRPYGDLYEKGLAALYKVLPYRWPPIGTIAHLRAATAAEIRAFWTTWYVPNNAVLVIVGDVTHAGALTAARRYFGWIPARELPPRPAGREAVPEAVQAVTITCANAPTSMAGLIWRTVPDGHKDTNALDFLAEILGGGADSVIYRDLVIERRLAVEAGTSSRNMEMDGIFLAGAVLSPASGDTAGILTEMLKHVEAARTAPPAADKIEGVRNRQLKGVVQQGLTVGSKAKVLGYCAAVLGDASFVNRQISDIMAVTADDVMRVAATYLVPGRRIEATVPRNLLGALTGGGKATDENTAVAAAETEAPAPGRPGVTRPEGYPRTAPLAPIAPEIPVPAYATRTLPNGLQVIVVPNREVPFVSISLGLRGGLWSEPSPGTAGMAMDLAVKATAKRTEKELAEYTALYAIGLGSNTGNDGSRISLNCVTAQLSRTLDLAWEVVASPAFPVDQFNLLVSQLRTSLAIEETKASFKADLEFDRCIYGDHPYARPAGGTLKDLDKLTLDAVKGWWTAWARPETAVLLVCGDTDLDAILKLVEPTFGAWKVEAPAPAVKNPPFPGRSATHIWLIDQPGAAQSEIRVGQAAITRDDPAWVATRIINEYFGGGFKSRLNERIRVEKGLTYAVGGGFAAKRDAGHFFVDTFSKTEATAEAVRAIIAEIKALRETPPAAAEMQTAVNYLIGSFVLRYETPQQIGGELMASLENGRPLDYVPKLMAQVRITGADAVVAAVKEIIDPGQLVIVVAGNAAALREPLAAIAPVTLVGGTAVPAAP
ncbi:MAG: pitrilysin family protein [Planctomycetota bacterium]